jgi:alcohol dehydrogenase (NADP+)
MRAIGLSDISLNGLVPIHESARIKPAVVQVEAHPYLPETELLEFCKEKDVVFLAFAPLGHGIRPGPLDDPVISAIAARVGNSAHTLPPAARGLVTERRGLVEGARAESAL